MKAKTSSVADHKEKDDKKTKKAGSIADGNVANQKPQPSMTSNSNPTSQAPSNKNKFTINQKAHEDHGDMIHDEHHSVSQLKIEKEDLDGLGKHNFVDSVGQDTHGMINDIGKQNKPREVTIALIIG